MSLTFQCHSTAVVLVRVLSLYLLDRWWWLEGPYELGSFYSSLLTYWKWAKNRPKIRFFEFKEKCGL